MKVQEDRVLPPGPYQAVLDDIEIKETAHGERLMWTFGIPSENAQVVGFSSLNEKTRLRLTSGPVPSPVRSTLKRGGDPKL